MKPIIFIFGPSGVGKSYFASLIEKKNFLFMHIDTDKKERAFAANGFPSEWDSDFSKVEFDLLVNNLQKRVGVKYDGVLVSFPTVYRFAKNKLDYLIKLEVAPLLLWGSEEDCKKSAEARINKKGIEFDLNRYDKNNLETFLLYSDSDYDVFRLEAFKKDGSRFSDEELKGKISDFIKKFTR